MGGNKRYADQPLRVPTWAATVAAMQAAGVLVSARCRANGCGYYKGQIDYAALIAAGHGGLCLFDYHPPCPRPGCMGAILFSYAPSPSTPARPCVSIR